MSDRAADVVNVKDFGAVGDGVTDDTVAIQRCVDYFSESTRLPSGDFPGHGGTVEFPPGNYLTNSQITVRRTGITFKGAGNMASVISVNHAGIGIYVEPYYQDVFYNQLQYGRFWLNDIRVSATGAGIDAATGVYLHGVHECTWERSAFAFVKYGVQMQGCHMMRFHNLYAVQNPGLNYAITAVADAEGVNEIVVDGATLIVSSLDLSNITNCYVKHIDVEPASTSILAGDGNCFSDLRLERLNQFSPMAYLTIGSDCRITRCAVNFAGPTIPADPAHPIYQVNGNDNYIELLSVYVSQNLVTFGSGAKRNTIIQKGRWDDDVNTGSPSTYDSQRLDISIADNPQRIVYDDTVLRAEVIGPDVIGFGSFKNLLPSTRTISSSGSWTLSPGSKSSATLGTHTPANRTQAGDFVYFATTTTSWHYFYPTAGIVIPADGTYTLSCVCFIPSSGGVESVGINLDPKTIVVQDTVAGVWKYIRTKAKFTAGQTVYPKFQFYAASGKVCYMGEMYFGAGEVGCYVPTTSSTPVEMAFPTQPAP
jgi:hypothetical protein